ncbi:hypothetical protein HNP84_000426 [Thermocatellispora tengchongensis]|uniref:Uncharacterized protein n=1 Tax=Thermocatellispora tengchongensis TaxID=1073253 RepID=A0A840NT34_9ACTN|nr:hypothetical protein [Thermocatellispora tengchongensis]MBB5130738.1 hypothetical protein [Thermocatellispora tengchongensis]
MHWHAYTWIGPGDDRGREAERRPDSPEFATSPLPPMRTGDWLVKPASRIAGTFSQVQDATAWLAEQYKAAEGLFLHPDRIGLDERLEQARDLLARGVDVQWGEWLTGGRFITVGVVCCPNRHVRHRCPAVPRRGSGQSMGTS